LLHSCLIWAWVEGKTVITLSAILDLMFDSFTVQHVLVIAPLRVARDTWPAEIRKWDHLRDLTFAVAVGSVKERRRAILKRADITIINRENVPWLINSSGLPFDYDMVVVDELSSFKNYKSQRFKALMSMRPRVKRIVGLTGTPASNGLMDLWSEYKLLDMGRRLGRFIGRYREAFFKAGSMNPYTGVVYNYVPLPGAEEAIYQKISDISVSMKAKDFLPDLPKCLTVNHTVEMSPEEKVLYEKLKKELVLTIDGEEIDAANAAVLSGRLLEMANGAVYNEDHEVIRIHDKKLEMLSDLIEEAVGQSVLIAYWYQHDRSRIIEYLTDMGYQVRDLKTAEDMTDWNAGKIPVALISPASAGHGLNLQHGGHILIWFSLCWSLEMRQQTDARLNRQGQTEPVTIHNIVTKDTIDEDVLKALEDKNSTQESLIQAVKARLR
jgi:SNF2 family DNA or RNA helicase